MKRICICLLLISIFFLSNNSLAQQVKRTDHWYFGTLAGLDFSSGTPVGVNNINIGTSEGSATISDTSGNLLIVTNGVQVWDKTGSQMPNGSGLLGDVSTTQVLIAPNPGDSNLYYIFTLTPDAGGSGLNYSVVDMTKNGGNGDVTVKNTHLHNSMTEKVAGVYHCNNHDIWIMTHENGTDAFLAYLLTNGGINAPIVSHTGITHTTPYGYMKFSSDGNKLACAVGYQDTVQLFDFNKATGMVSNPVTMPTGPSQKSYGLEFSPDNSKLYFGSYDPDQTYLYQVDLTAADIPASRVLLNSSYDFIYRGIQLGPDNKIYVIENNSSFLDAINSPNLAGTSCDLQAQAVNLDPNSVGAMSIIGLPGFIQSYFNPQFPHLPCFVPDFRSSDTVICESTCISFTDLTVGSPNKWRWFFPGATIDSSNVQNPPTVCYNTAGQFDVMLIASDISGTDTVTKHNFIIVGPHEVGGVVTATRDTICAGTSGNLSLAGNSSNAINWQSSTDDNNFTDISGATSSTYKTPGLEQTTYYRARVGTGNCASVSDTQRLYVPPQLVAKFNSTGSGKTVTFDSDSSEGKISSYHWDFNDGQTSTDSSPSHTYARDSTYYVCLTLFDGSNCSYTFCKYTTVGGNGIATIAAQGKWAIYPNPVSNYIYINSSGAGEKIVSVEIYDVLGRTVLSIGKETGSTPLKIDASFLTHGMYFLRIKTMEMDYVQKIIKL